MLYGCDRHHLESSILLMIVGSYQLKKGEYLFQCIFKYQA